MNIFFQKKASAFRKCSIFNKNGFPRTEMNSFFIKELSARGNEHIFNKRRLPLTRGTIFLAIVFLRKCLSFPLLSRIRRSEAFCISSITILISLILSRIVSERRRISVATIWKFLPASPELAASSSALKAMILVWSATLLIIPTMSQMPFIFVFSSFIPSVVSIFIFLISCKSCTALLFCEKSI